MRKQLCIPDFYLASEDPDRVNTVENQRKIFKACSFYTDKSAQGAKEGNAFMPSRRPQANLMSLDSATADKHLIQKKSSQRLPFLDVILSPSKVCQPVKQDSNSDSSERNSSSESASGDNKVESSSEDSSEDSV